MTPEEYKKLSVKEFTQAAKIYDSGHAGIYEMCKDDYPPILAELEKEPFCDVLDCGCGTGSMIQLLHEKYPNKRYVGLDLTPEMIQVAQEKQIDIMDALIKVYNSFLSPKIDDYNSSLYYENPSYLLECYIENTIL